MLRGEKRKRRKKDFTHIPGFVNFKVAKLEEAIDVKFCGCGKASNYSLVNFMVGGFDSSKGGNAEI